MKYFILFCTVLLSASTGFTQQATKEHQEAEFKKLSNDWMVATMNRDAKTLNKLVAPEFKLGGTNLEAPAINREIWMENTMENLKIDSVNYIKMNVDVMAEVVIVQSLFYWSVAFGTFPAKADTVKLIDTWVNREKGWQVVSRLVVD